MSRGTRSCCRKRLLRRVAWESPPHQEGSARSASLLLELPLEASAASVLRRPEASGASGSQLPVASEVSLRPLRPLWLRPEALVRSRRRLREASGALRSRHLGASGRSPSSPRAASAPSPSRLPGVLVALLNPLQLEVGLARSHNPPNQVRGSAHLPSSSQADLARQPEASEPSAMRERSGPSTEVDSAAPRACA